MRLRTALALTAATLFSLSGTAIQAGAATRAPQSAAGSAAASAQTAALLPAADPTPVAKKKLFTIRDERLQESSGLAKSQKYEGIYWTMNDSGDTARVFAIDTTGKVKAELRFKAEVRDVEAIAVDRDGTIYIADIGDNKANRDQIEIYTIPEPDALEDAENVRYHRYDFEYPDGAHDAETLLVEPGTNQLYIVTKAEKGVGGIYAAPPDPSRQGTNELTKLAPAPTGTFTDGTFLPDGQRVVLRTYTGLATVRWGEKPNVIARATVSADQGESVAVGPSGSGDTVLVGSEGSNSAVYQVAVPAPKSGAQPSASTTPKASTADDSGDTSKSHNLRWILIGAAVFAFIITIITFPPGRRERLDRMAENARLTGQSPPTPHRRP
ncbi:hypothetical protein EV646_104427 [Kribbella antiqua]|uniref:Esterase-like activity of phytase family protein n=1 Tax=Kribbella antiqua TaxID=2512217 RepID=A0A4R2J047_9ACTN|nr:hypothetical protein [Kribbella antiqua]TCO48605.1 hypothetical protein EV646_104427 [Kribbella antiqua]